MKQTICKSMKQTIVSTNRLPLCIAFLSVIIGMGMLASCTNSDNPSSGQESTVVTPDQLKQGVWTEYDAALEASGDYTEEELAAMPAVGMKIDGAKATFFTYTADDISEAVEGQINYDNKTGKGTITFPAIKDNPLSDQTVSFSMTTDETMEFEFTYEGQKTTGTCAWLCENLDNWSSDITDEDWKELMKSYEAIAATSGPDASIDWSKSVEVEDIDDNGNPVKVEVKDLDKPLVWEEDAVAPARTRAIGVGTVVSVGLKILGALFKDDSSEKKLDAITEKVDKVLQGQQEMLKKLNEYNNRLTAIAKQMKQTETVNIFNNRNEKYYNPLKVRNRSYFDDAYELYTTKKNELSQEDKKHLGDYAEKWVGSNNEYINLTWQYMEYLTTVQHSTYGTGIDKIYDGIIYDEYPWEHLGTEDRKCYRGNDLLMITKCLFMICLYSTYCNLDDIDKKALYNNYNAYRPQLEKFCEFTVANPDEFRVCQIPGAHFVMHKELQKYNFCGADKKRPQENSYGNNDAAYFPEWHEKGKIKIENPKELKSKLITRDEADAIFKYYAPNNEKIWWTNMIVNGNTAGGAAYAQAPSYDEPCLMLYDPQNRNNDNGVNLAGAASNELTLGPVMRRPNINWCVYMGWIETFTHQLKWSTYKNIEYYAAIVEKRY